jgi:cyclase
MSDPRSANVVNRLQVIWHALKSVPYMAPVPFACRGRSSAFTEAPADRRSLGGGWLDRPEPGAMVIMSIATLAIVCGIGPDRVGAQQQDADRALQRSLEIRQAQSPNDGEVYALPVQGNVYMLVGAGGNVAVQTGDQGVLVVDTGTAQMSEKVLAAIRKLSNKPIRYIINTHFHPDHTGGNEAIAKAGVVLQGGPTAGRAGGPAEIVSHENVLNRMSAPTGKQALTPTAAWPTNTYVPEEKDFFFNDEPVMLYHDHTAHTDGDTIVFFRRSDVVVAGDIFVTTSYPVIDAQNGGTVEGIINGLNRILDLTVPKHEQEGGTYVIPGHGKVSDESEVLEYRDTVTIIRDRIEDMVKRGMTVEQVKAARPTLDYDLHYGANSGPWTTAMFIEAVYKDVSRAASRQSTGPGAAAKGKPAPKGKK